MINNTNQTSIQGMPAIRGALLLLGESPLMAAPPTVSKAQVYKLALKAICQNV